MSGQSSKVRAATGRGWFGLGIRQKLVLVLSVVLLTTLTLAGWLLIEMERRDFLAATNQRGEDISGYVAKSLAYSVVGYDYHAIQLLLDEIASSEEIAFARVSNAEGRPMGEAGRALPAAEMRTFRQPILMNEQQIGELELALDVRDSLASFTRRTRELLWWELLVTLIVVIGEFIALSMVIARPVRNITSAIEQMSGGDPASLREIATSSRDEFGVMARHFNELSRRLRESYARLQSKMDLADRELVAKNQQLQQQSVELRKVNEELRQLSVTDELTGLYNRRHFHEHLAKEVALVRRYNQSVSLLLIDLDHFKPINDHYGHSVGDAVLQQFAARLRQRMRQSDVLCRVGGEEFAVLCKRTGHASVMELAEQLRRCVQEQPVQVEDIEIRLTVSIGAATLPVAGVEIGDRHLYGCADRALYWSKEHGRNRATHCEEIADADVAKQTA